MSILFKNILLAVLSFAVAIMLFSCKSTPKETAQLNVEQTGVLDLKKDLVRDGNTLKFNVSSILFAYKSTSIIDDRGALGFIHNFSKKCDKKGLRYTISVIGHTDTRGSEDENQILSEKRSEKIVSLLQNKGVSKEKLAGLGKGESDPISTFKVSPENVSYKDGTFFKQVEKQHQLNRRVVFEFKFIDAPPKVNVVLP